MADTPEQAEHAASLIRVTYAAERGTNSFEESIPHATQPKDLMGEATEVKKGNADQVFQDAAHRVDLTFTTPPHNHNAIEPHASIAFWEEDDKVTLYDTSQFTVGTAGSIAAVFGLKEKTSAWSLPFSAEVSAARVAFGPITSSASLQHVL